MATHRIKVNGGIAIVTMPNIYEYGGYKFEFHEYMGPSIVNKDLEHRKGYIGARSKFWKPFEKWLKLSKSAKKKTLIYS